MVRLPAPGLPALHRAVRASDVPTLRRAPAAWLAVVVVTLSTLMAPALQAWDVDRFTAAAQRLGPQALQTARVLQSTMGRAASLDEAGRARTMNDFFNQHLSYVDDRESLGVVDHWASPLESLARGQGDCEDYAIAKYFSLVALGVPMHKLRLVYVRVQAAGLQPTPHMVLAYYPSPNADPLVLDNLLPEIRAASMRPDLQPVFSFNADGLWQGSRGDRAGDPVARLSRWRDVLARATAEGF
jgi:predicted transglutaminase-like cysteine proteinase